MLTKRTSDEVMTILTAHICCAVGGPVDFGGPYFPSAVVSVERDMCRRAWVVYFIDGDGRLQHETMLDDCSSAHLDATLAEATRQSNEGGIDPAALLATDEMAKLGAGWRDRAASRWSAQVRAKVKERDEAARVRVWCQGEED